MNVSVAEKTNKEVKGLFRAGAFLLAFIVAVIGLVFMIASLLGIIIWLLGFGWMTYLLTMNIKDKQKSGFKAANIAIKIVLMLFMIIFFILILTAR